MVGSVGQVGAARLAGNGERADAALADQRQHAADVAEEHLHLFGHHAGYGFGCALVWHVDDVDAGPLLEQLGGEMAGVADAGGAEVELAGIGLGQSHEFADRFCRKIRMHHQHFVILRGLGDRR